MNLNEVEKGRGIAREYCSKLVTWLDNLSFFQSPHHCPLNSSNWQEFDVVTKANITNRFLRTVALCCYVCRYEHKWKLPPFFKRITSMFTHRAKEWAFYEILMSAKLYVVAILWIFRLCLTAVLITRVVDTVTIRKKYFRLSAKRADHANLNIRIYGWKGLCCNGVLSRCNNGHLKQK
jgi:hypothetical protein